VLQREERMAPKTPTDRELLLVTSCSLFLFANRLAKRDPRSCEITIRHWTELLRLAERTGYDAAILLRFVREKNGERIANRPGKQTAISLMMNFDAVYSTLFHARRPQWYTVVRDAVKRITPPAQMPVKEIVRLQHLLLENTLTIRQATLAILSAAGLGTEKSISTRLQRCGHRLRLKYPPKQ
jgi:hypothetical protein